MAEILGIGGLCVDRLGIIPRIPEWDDIEYMTAYSMQPGGMAATAMAAVARLGGMAEFIGGVGDDDAGTYLLQALQRAKINTDRVRIFPGGTTALTFAMVHSVSGKRSLIHYRGVQGQSDLELPAIDLSGVKFLHVDGYWIDTVIQTARNAKAHGITVTLDPSSSILKKKHAEELFWLADYLMPSCAFARKFTNHTDIWKAADTLLEFNPQAVIITNGEDGCFVRTSTQRCHIPAFPVDVVDTTGAGDTFHGAYLFGLQQGYDVLQAVRFASAVAALQCTKLGGHAGIPTFEETLAFLEKHGVKCQTS